MSSSDASRQNPSLVKRCVGSERIGVRFKQIGSRQRFNGILQRFRTDFLLATCEELEGQVWWIISSSQTDELKIFCRRNGLGFEEES